jgi:hypothetical protein
MATSHPRCESLGESVAWEPTMPPSHRACRAPDVGAGPTDEWSSIVTDGIRTYQPPSRCLRPPQRLGGLDGLADQNAFLSGKSVPSAGWWGKLPVVHRQQCVSDHVNLLAGQRSARCERCAVRSVPDDEAVRRAHVQFDTCRIGTWTSPYWPSRSPCIPSLLPQDATCRLARTHGQYWWRNWRSAARSPGSIS